MVPPELRGGFDYWLGYENINEHFRCYVHGTDTPELVRLPGYETDALTDRFIGHIRKHVSTTGGKDNHQPFFAALSVTPPHNPYIAPADYARRRTAASVQLRPNVPAVKRVEEAARLGLASYYGMIENLDDNLGRVREALYDMGIDENTIIMFFSDHGEMLGSHGQFGKSAPWEESVRIPMVIGSLHNAKLTACTRSDAPMNHVDIAPTTLGLCGIAQPEWMVGYSYAHLALHPKHPLYKPASAPEPDSAYMQQIPRKRHAHSVNKSWRGVVTRDGWKYVVTPGNDWLLHNLNEDPYEQVNLAHDQVYAAQRKKLRARLEQWISATDDSFELPPED
jgi:arylsulfatase A-like enzyme